ncbi:prepilin-type N-terminal cleavage/methylation domain-containing protein [bacterium]|nr:prepilin-type N-terminal cleavage/methylation domain-containing protein [bacterium]
MKHAFANNRSTGFTLIELLIVVAIIAILAAIAVPNFLEAQTRSKVSRVQADLRSIATAVESYYIEYNRYMPYSVPVAGKVGEQQIFLLTSPVAYMTSIPEDVFQANRPAKTTVASKNFIAFFGPVPRYFVYSGNTFLLNGNTGWSLRCMGPDTDWDLVGYAPDNDTTVPQNGNYDPTNGTISNGDVLRSGGGISFFNR